MKRLRKYVGNPGFDPEAIKRISIAASGLCQWVHAMYSYCTISQVMREKRNALREAQRVHDQLITDMTLVQAQVRPITNLWEAAQKCASMDASATDLMTSLRNVRTALDEKNLAAALARSLALPWMKEGEPLPEAEDDSDDEDDENNLQFTI